MKKEKVLRKVIVKIGLKQEEEEKEIVVKVLLDSRTIGLVVSLEFARKNKFKKTKLERLIYVRNVDGTFNYEGPIKHIMEIELFFKEHKERISINIIEG